MIVQQVDGSVSATTSTGAVLTVTFGPVDGTHHRVTGFNIDRDTLLALAATASPSPDGIGGIIDPGVGPAGLTETAVGAYFESWFVPNPANQMQLPAASWSDGEDRSIWYMTIEQDPSLLGLGRLGGTGCDGVTDITINGHAGYLATGTRGTATNGFITIGWADDTRTVLVGTRGFTPTEASQLAERLRPATDVERQELLSTQPTTPPANRIGRSPTSVPEG